MRLRITHATTFTYDEPVSEAYMEMRLTPLDAGGQRCESFRLTPDPPGEVRSYVDRFGNRVRRSHRYSVQADQVVAAGVPAGELGAQLAGDLVEVEVAACDPVLVQRDRRAVRFSPDMLDQLRVHGGLDHLAVVIARFHREGRGLSRLVDILIGLAFALRAAKGAGCENVRRVGD